MGSSSSEPKPVRGKCPICGAPAAPQSRPFCSARCADIDLGRWVAGAYVITGGDSDSDEDGASDPSAGTLPGGPTPGGQDPDGDDGGGAD